MNKFITHDAIAQGILNADYSSATGALSVRHKECTNSEVVLDLMLERMSSDFESLNPKMRKPWTAKDLEPGT